MSRIHIQGPLRGDKIAYPDGVGCCIWYPLPGTEDAGICFDFPASDIPDMIRLLIDLNNFDADKFEEDEESAAVVAELKE